MVMRRQSRADKRRVERNIKGVNRRHSEPPDLQVKTQIKDNNFLIWLGNALVAGNCYSLRDAINEETIKSRGIIRIVVNMEKVTYVDTGAISLLFELHKHFVTEKIPFILYRVTPRVKEILGIVNMDKLFDIRDH